MKRSRIKSTRCWISFESATITQQQVYTNQISVVKPSKKQLSPVTKLSLAHQIPPFQPFKSRNIPLPPNKTYQRMHTNPPRSHSIENTIPSHKLKYVNIEWSEEAHSILTFPWNDIPSRLFPFTKNFAIHMNEVNEKVKQIYLPTDHRTY